MVVGGYDLHLYCETVHDRMDTGTSAQFAAHTKGGCLADAHKAGWRVFWEKQEAWCPKCVKAGKHREAK